MYIVKRNELFWAESGWLTFKKTAAQLFESRADAKKCADKINGARVFKASSKRFTMH